jgi:hypothetical protein
LCGKNKNSLHRFCTGFLCQIIYITICHYNKKMVEAAGVEPKADLTAMRFSANLPNDYRMN